MVDKTTTEFIIRTKLHRPPIHPHFISRPHLFERLENHRQRPLTLVSAPAGYGKSTLVSSWLEIADCPGGWISLDYGDNDLGTFVSYLIAAVQSMFPDACRKTLSFVNAMSLPSLSFLASSLVNDLDLIEQPFILVLDDFHLIKDESVLDLIKPLLHHPPRAMHLVLIGRRDPTLPIPKLRAKNLLTEIRTQDLLFNDMEIKKLLTQMLGFQVDSATAAALAKKTEGWVTGLVLAAFSMRNQGSLDPVLLEPQVDSQYVMEYLFTEVFSKQPPQMIQYLLATAILDRFCGPLCEAVCLPGTDPDPSTNKINGWDFIAWLKKKNLFLIHLDPQNRWFRYHHLFQRLLHNQLMRHRRAGEIKSLHTRASAWYFDNDLIEEGLQHALAAGDAKTASSVVARLGPQLMDEQNWQRLERWLRLLPRDQVEQDPELFLLETWLYHLRHDYSNQLASQKMIEALAAFSPPNPSFSSKHIQGQLDALRGIRLYNDADGQNALTHLQRACENIPDSLKRVQQLARIYLLGAYQMMGDFAAGLAGYLETMKRLTSKDRSYHSAYLTSLCSAYWINADLYAMRQTAESALMVARHHQLPDTVPYVLYFQGIFHYQRNELKTAEEKLIEVVDSFGAKSPMNYAHSAFALAFCYQAQGKNAKARKISKAIIAYTVESNNADILQFARAFEAELALRQGSIAKASRLARSLNAFVLLPMHKFYFPQLTLIKILLAEGTIDSKQRAADLLDESLDFMRSIHNKRFQIDLLALRSLLFDWQHDEPEAIKALTESLTIAEPAGFIRPFVELGSPMVDLLKRLHKQKIAVNYIESILTAFRAEEQIDVLDATGHESKSPPRPSPHSNSDFRIRNSTFQTSPSPSYSAHQPLAEPLTNRELDVLVLLAQRLSNKEIADNLFISTRTVKAHLQNIYGKLNVNRRREAIEKAKKIGVLSI